MAHGYFYIDLEIVREALCNDFSVLEATFHTVIEANSKIKYA